MSQELFNKLIYTDEEVDEELLAALIKAGSHEYIKTAITKPTEEEESKVSFSKAFEERMQKQLNIFKHEEKRERRTNILRRIRKVAVNVAACLFAIIIISSAFVATSEAAKIEVMNTLIDVFNIKTDFRFSYSDNNQANETNLSSMLGYIPVGLEIVDELNLETYDEVEYDSNTGIFMSFRKQESGSVTIDTENTDAYELLIGEYNCYVSEKEDDIIIIFEDGIYAYTLKSNLSFEEIKKVLLNLK